MSNYTDKEVLYLFREFVIKNATQWKLGSNHHHPMWGMVAEKLEGMEDITKGPKWEFIQATNDKSLRELVERHLSASKCPICKGKKFVWKGGQGGDYEECECQKIVYRTM